MLPRGSGVLLHITSLPSAHGIGDLGPQAHAFAKALHQERIRYWQVLPMGPTSPAIGNSPYSSCSAFAGNPLCIDLGALAAAGWLPEAQLQEGGSFQAARVEYEKVEAFKERCLRTAFEAASPSLDADPFFQAFLEESPWLDDFACFVTLKARYGGAIWTDWPEPFRDRHPMALAAWKKEAAREIRYQQFVQHCFARQWQALRKVCAKCRVQLVGDVPIYVTFDSADVWANPHLFKLDAQRRPVAVAGVPPDYFSETGQLWGNPVYDWDAAAATGYAWWVQRMGHAMAMYDLVRLDHFRGFAGYWEVPAGEKTAINGQWVDAPGMAFFAELTKSLPGLRILAEDLGVITPDVRELKKTYGFPGMKILQFAFGPGIGENPDAPHNHEENCVVYTGTHDNNTTLGWWLGEAAAADRDRLRRYTGRYDEINEPHWLMIQIALASVGHTAIVPMQDLLGLGCDCRMNTPGLANGNWTWRCTARQLESGVLQRFGDLAALFGRG
ncbi:4-alpha-glucanotransferase [Megalodesulfovibrio paquesii]